MVVMPDELRTDVGKTMVCIHHVSSSAFFVGQAQPTICFHRINLLIDARRGEFSNLKCGLDRSDISIWAVALEPLLSEM
jgi:hypothetical protein